MPPFHFFILIKHYLHGNGQIPSNLFELFQRATAKCQCILHHIEAAVLYALKSKRRKQLQTITWLSQQVKSPHKSSRRNEIYISICWQILKWLTVWTTREQLNKICTLRWTFKGFLIQGKLLQQTGKHKSASNMTSLIDSKMQISKRIF